jgi:hypothetical protein
MAMKYKKDNFRLLKFTFIIIQFFHGILEVDNFEISLPKKNICPQIPINFYVDCYACKKQFPKNWLISHLYYMSSFEIIFPEV